MEITVLQKRGRTTRNRVRGSESNPDKERREEQVMCILSRRDRGAWVLNSRIYRGGLAFKCLGKRRAWSARYRCNSRFLSTSLQKTSPTTPFTMPCPRQYYTMRATESLNR